MEKHTSSLLPPVWREKADGHHRWWSATTWREAYCVHCGADYVAWYQLTQERLDLAQLADECSP